jgi:hypothetical protein
MRYIVVTNLEKNEEKVKAKDKFQEDVANLIRNGFKCVGGVSISVSVAGKVIYAQAMMGE